jgi:hypothetical protein
VAGGGIELELLLQPGDLEYPAQSQKVVMVKSAMTTGAPAANAA